MSARSSQTVSSDSLAQRREAGAPQLAQRDLASREHVLERVAQPPLPDAHEIAQQPGVALGGLLSIGQVDLGNGIIATPGILAAAFDP